MVYVMKVGVLRDKKAGKVYKPGDELPKELVEKSKKAIEAGVKAGTIVEKGKAPVEKESGKKK